MRAVALAAFRLSSILVAVLGLDVFNVVNEFEQGFKVVIALAC